MITQPSNDTLTTAAACEKPSDSEWVALHVPRFEKAAEAFKTYERFLREVLELACKRLVPSAIVEARTKSLPSFAEKILRKRRTYENPKNPLPSDPLLQMTDLCGGRVVTQTAAEMRTFCRFIEEAFEIDWANSEDVSQRLKPAEFGYRSVHYIIQPSVKKLKAAGIKVEIPKVLFGFPEKTVGAQVAGRPLKAEIQVRTLLEHAAAALGHGTIYKSNIRVPDRITRHHATLAAILEGVDSGFGELLSSLGEFRSSFGTYHDRAAVEREIDLLRIVLKYEPRNTALAVRIAQHALAIGSHEAVGALLKPFSRESHFGVQRTLGQALTEMHWDEPNSRGFRAGRMLLEAASVHKPKDSETLCLLAESIAHDDRDDETARGLFYEAIVADPNEPVTLARYLEFEIAHLGNDNAARLSAPMISAAIDRCGKQIEANVNLPAAWSSLAFFSLLRGKPFEALNAIAHIGALCQGHGKPAGHSTPSRRPCAAGRALARLRGTLLRLRCIKEKLDGYDWCERAVLLLLAVRVADSGATAELRKLASVQKGPFHFSFADKIVILAGGCIREVQPQIDTLKPHLVRGCEGLQFTVLCGGTTAGISRLTGDIAEQSNGAIIGIGYMPASLPRGSKEDENEKRFRYRFSSTGKDFTPLDPFQGWTDLIAGGVDASRVKLLAYAGGSISHAECALALGLGARVGVIENVSLPADRQFLDPTWQEHPNLVRLPMDAMTLRAFLLVDQVPLSEADQKRFEKAAHLAHEEYVRSAMAKDPSLASWKDLSPELRLSNFHQVAYWEECLREVQIGLRPIGQTAQPPAVTNLEDVTGEEGIRHLAEKEHGRWNVERLLRGWKHADTKDVSKKLNPCLVPWTVLADVNGQDYRPYDIDAIRGLPAKFRAAGLELYKL